METKTQVNPDGTPYVQTTTDTPGTYSPPIDVDQAWLPPHSPTTAVSPDAPKNGEWVEPPETDPHPQRPNHLNTQALLKALEFADDPETLCETLHITEEELMEMIESPLFIRRANMYITLREVHVRLDTANGAKLAIRKLNNLMQTVSEDKPEVIRRTAVNLLTIAGYSCNTPKPTPEFFNKSAPPMSTTMTGASTKSRGSKPYVAANSATSSVVYTEPGMMPEPYNPLCDPYQTKSTNFYHIMERIHLHLPFTKAQIEIIKHGPDYQTDDDIVKFMRPEQAKLWYYARFTGNLPPYPLHLIPDYRCHAHQVT